MKNESEERKRLRKPSMTLAHSLSTSKRRKENQDRFAKEMHHRTNLVHDIV